MTGTSIASLRRYVLDRMVLRPTRHPIEYSPQRRVMLSEGRHRLECFVQANQNEADRPPDLLVLKFPGTAGRAECSTIFPTSMLDGTRVEIWTWNPPGYGNSPGRASLQGMANAAIEFWTQVTRRYDGISLPIWLCGNSLGCATALHVASSIMPNPTRCGIILRNPPLLKRVVSRVARQYPLGRFLDPVVESLCESMDAIKTAPRVKLPAVFMKSEFDELVLPRFQDELHKAYGGPSRMILLEGLGHADVATEIHQPLVQESVDWLWNSTALKTDESSCAH